MNPVITLKFTPTLRDYLFFNRQEARHRLRWLVPFALLALVTFLCSPLIPFDGSPSIVEKYRAFAGALFLPAIVFVVMPVSIYVAAKRRWEAAAELREPRAYEFSEDAVTVAGGTFSGTTSWSHIVRAKTARSLILLYTAQRAAHIIPVEVFENTQQVEAFKELIRRKIPDCSRLR